MGKVNATRRALLPDLDGKSLSLARENPRVSAALDDLDVALVSLGQCAAGTREHADWEATRDELLAEIRRAMCAIE